MERRARRGTLQSRALLGAPGGRPTCPQATCHLALPSRRTFCLGFVADSGSPYAGCHLSPPHLNTCSEHELTQVLGWLPPCNRSVKEGVLTSEMQPLAEIMSIVFVYRILPYLTKLISCHIRQHNCALRRVNIPSSCRSLQPTRW